MFLPVLKTRTQMAILVIMTFEFPKPGYQYNELMSLVVNVVFFIIQKVALCGDLSQLKVLKVYFVSLRLMAERICKLICGLS